MNLSRTAQAAVIGVVVVLFFGSCGTYMWLSRQGPVLSRSEEKDPLSGTPKSVIFNPLRDHSAENAAAPVIEAMRDGKCREVLADWEKDYRKKYASFVCASEAQHPLISWKLVDWEERPPLIILHYRGKRHNAPGQDGFYTEHFWVTTEMRDGVRHVTKYDAMY